MEWSKKRWMTIQVVALTFLGAAYLVTALTSIKKTILVEHRHAAQLVEEDPGRNENSTPRSFILPATAAVAAAQERKHENERLPFDIDRCVSILVVKGYDLEGERQDFSFALERAVFKFQSSLGLPANGLLDTATAKALGCSL
jgi:murein L,D-transpeptidase YcbB/YkuD